MAIQSENLPIVLFDGACNLCHRSVQFCLKHEDPNKNPQLKFSSLDSEYAQKILQKHGLSSDSVESVIYVDQGERVFQKSSAAFQIARYLKFPFLLLQYFSYLPVFLTDFPYSWVAKYRYRLFGKLDQCQLPEAAPDQQCRFID